MCVTRPSPKVLDNVSQLLAPAYHRVAASGMLRDCIQVYIPLLVWHSETGCSDGHTEAKSAEEMFHMHRLSQFSASQDSIPNTSEVKPVCMLSEPSSSLHMLRQKFAGSQFATRAALSLFASKFPLI